MKIAVASEGRMVAQHFGHCEGFNVFTVQEGKITESKFFQNPGHKPGFLPNYLNDMMHEASITFLGFGLPPHEPAIGVILSESMKYLTSGKWWLAFFPGLSLVLISMMVDCIGKNIEKLINPKTAYK